jgi:hypothetical protein
MDKVISLTDRRSAGAAPATGSAHYDAVGAQPRTGVVEYTAVAIHDGVPIRHLLQALVHVGLALTHVPMIGLVIHPQGQDPTAPIPPMPPGSAA